MTVSSIRPLDPATVVKAGVPVETVRRAERLRHRLLRREPGRERRVGTRAPLVGELLTGSEEPVAHAGRALERRREPRHAHDVRADPDDHLWVPVMAASLPPGRAAWAASPRHFQSGRCFWWAL